MNRRFGYPTLLIVLLTGIVVLLNTLTAQARATTPATNTQQLTAAYSTYLPIVHTPTDLAVRSIFIEAEDGTIEAPLMRGNGYIVNMIETTDPTRSGKATYRFHVAEPGAYWIKLIVNAPDTGANSAFLGIDTSRLTTNQLWDIPLTNGFETRTLVYRGTPEQPFQLTAGAHSLVIAGRERNLQIDRIVIEPAEITTTGPTQGSPRFGPPTMRNPKTVVLTNANPSYSGSQDEDVIIRLGERITRPVKISNVHNMILIGGEFTISKPLTADLPNTREEIAKHRALALSDITGVAYLEGISINDSGGGLSEAFQIWSTPGTVIIRNSRIEGVHTKPGDSGFNFNHPDLFQPMSGQIVLENVTLANSDYQGMFIGQESGQQLTSVFFRNVNTRNISQQAWFFHDLDAGVVRGCENCWHDPTGSRYGNDFTYCFYPHPPVINGNAVWMDEPSIVRGMTIRRGLPPGGDFAPANKVGLNYDPSFFGQ